MNTGPASRRVTGAAAGCGRRRRAGITLIELVVVISTLAVLMSFATVLMGLLFRADHAGQDALAGQLSIARLGRQFRADAHETLTVETAQDNTGALELTLKDGRRVNWTAAGGAVTRIARRNDAVLTRESYALPEGTATFSVSESGGLIHLQFTGPPPEVLENSAVRTPSPPDVLTINAAVGIEIPSEGTSATTFIEMP
jgi:Tfp pilus assembly protein FimT